MGMKKIFVTISPTWNRDTFRREAADFHPLIMLGFTSTLKDGIASGFDVHVTLALVYSADGNSNTWFWQFFPARLSD